MTMLTVFKPVGAEVSLGNTPTTLNNSKLVRLLNDTSAESLITITDSLGVQFATFTIAIGAEMLIQKGHAYTIQSSPQTIKAVTANY